MKTLNNTTMTNTATISNEIMTFVKANFAGYEQVNASLVSFGEAVEVLKHSIKIVRNRLSEGNSTLLRVVLGELISLRMEVEELID